MTQTKLTLNQIEMHLADIERHIHYVQEIRTSTAPGEYAFYLEKYDDLVVEQCEMRMQFWKQLRREIGQMKRRVNGGEKGLKSERNRLKRKYFEVLGEKS